ncbi:MAG: type II toxin-antitoxin system HicB family antitoxin [Clostridia bacterium]|nr:type II toxin-antitoxin system HicB family antitoxin [Clostridia bacterium]
MVYVYPATIQHEEDGRYSIWFEDLPGCATSGETLAEAIMMARDAMGGWLDCAMAHGDEIQAPSAPDDIVLESGQVIALVDMDLDAYRRENDQRAIKKTLTIPAWLNTRAERAGVNFSQVLQEALSVKLDLPMQRG